MCKSLAMEVAVLVVIILVVIQIMQIFLILNYKNVMMRSLKIITIILVKLR